MIPLPEIFEAFPPSNPDSNLVLSGALRLMSVAGVSRANRRPWTCLRRAISSPIVAMSERRCNWPKK